MAPAETGTWQPFLWDNVCTLPLATHPDDWPGNQPDGLRRPRHPYSVLLPVGFTLPPLLPAARWALTPPFHPYHYKSGGLLSAALSLGSPPPDVIRHRVFVEPGLSSPYRLSTLVKRGCPANWHGLLRRVQRRMPTENPQTSYSVQKSGAKSVS